MHKLLLIILVISGIFATAVRADSSGNETSINLQSYYKQTQTHPLFAWPGVDLNNMVIAIETLEKSRSEIAGLTPKQYNDRVTERVKQFLYPTHYLSKMLALERSRRALSEAVKYEELARYQAQLMSTIQSYQEYLDALIPELKSTVKEQDYKGLQYHFGQSSYKHLLGVLERYRKDSDDVLQQSIERWECANDSGIECEFSSWPILAHVSATTIDLEQFDGVNAKVLSSFRLKSKLEGKSQKPNWAVTTNHKCFSKHTEVYYFLWELDLGEGVPIWKADVLNDVLVHDHRINAETKNQYEIQLKELGAKGYIYQPYTTQYACPDLAADTGSLRSMLYVQSQLRDVDWPNIKRKDAGEHVSYQNLQEDGETISNQTYLSEPAIRKFVRDLGLLLNTREQAELAAVWGEPLLKKFQNMLLIYNSQTHHLSRDIMALVYANTAIGDYVNYAPWNFIEELLFIRNAPALLLGGFNATINRNDHRHVEKHRIETSPQLKSYYEHLSEEFTPEELTEILIHGTNAEYELSRLQNRSYFIRD